MVEDSRHDTMVAMIVMIEIIVMVAMIVIVVLLSHHSDVFQQRPVQSRHHHYLPKERHMQAVV